MIDIEIVSRKVSERGSHHVAVAFLCREVAPVSSLTSEISCGSPVNDQSTSVPSAEALGCPGGRRRRRRAAGQRSGPAPPVSAAHGRLLRKGRSGAVAVR